MKYLIVGTGGTGGCIGGFLAKSGKDVSFIARGSHLEAIRENGLQLISSRIGNFTLKNVKAYAMEEYEGTPDVVFVCVKYYSIDETCDFLSRVVRKDTLVIPVLNVFGTGRVMQERLNCPVMDGCIYIYSMITAPGEVSQPTKIFKVYYGYRKGQIHSAKEVARKVHSDLTEAGIDAYFTQEIEKEALTKFSFVSPMGAAGLYYNAVGGDFKAEGVKRDTFIALVNEVKNLAEAMGIALTKDIVEKNLKIMDAMTDDSTTSMQRDVERHRDSEIDGLVHRVVRLAKEYGAQVPIYEKISMWAKQKEIK